MADASTSLMSCDSDNLRRSKRKKFRLDVVAAAHGNNQKKSNRDPHDDDDDELEEEEEQLSIQTDMGQESDYEEEDALSKRRTRRSTAHWGDYQDSFVDWVDQSGSFACSKCPSRYESRSSLSNHSKMHSGERRKFACELCDFSSSTQKSLQLHNNIHKRYGVISAQTSPAIVSSQQHAPDLSAEVPTGEEENADCDDSPPVLEREVSPPVLIAEVTPPPPVRKSGRPSKASKRSGTPGSTPRKYVKKKTQPKLLRLSTPAMQKPDGSLPRSSSSSSATPPLKESPVPPPVLMPELAEQSEKPTKKRRKCPQCPYTATSTTRLQRHSDGHRLTEGYRCPADNCNFTAKGSGVVLRHYSVHPEEMAWPPKYVGGEEKTDSEKAVEKVESPKKSKKMKQGGMMRSHRVVIGEGGAVMKRCDWGDCSFQTVSMTQLIIHKAKSHQSTSPASRKFLCIKCGLRYKSYADLRLHKLKRHPQQKNQRFHRTYYLKEMVGDKFFIKYYTSGGAPVKDHDGEESGDESFDSVIAPSNSTTSTSQLAEVIAKNPAAVFCCNMCPYQAPTMNRCQRHYDKHFAPAPFKCRHCSWSSRSQEVLRAHEKLHEPKEEPSESNETEVQPKKEEEPTKEMFHHPDTAALGASLQAWCSKEKSKRPELEEQFTRKLIEGVKGFQCVECPYISKYRGDMRSHKKRHDIEQMYRCVQCTYTTNRPVSLKDHLKQHLPTNLGLRQATPLLVNHGHAIGHRRGSGKDRIYCCNRCPYVTTTLGCIWRHYRNHRSTAKFYICSNCTYSSIEMRKMEEHCVIHTALGDNEPVPFVKRVDQEGRVVSSLTDLNAEKEKGERKTKRKTELAEPTEPAPKKSRRSKTPLERLTESPQPTRQLSERTTRSRHNYSLLSRFDSVRNTPVKNNIEQELFPCDNILGVDPNESVEVSHWRIRNYLNTEFAEKDLFKCTQCPFQNPDETIVKQHEFFHTPTEPPRPYTCCDCTFTTFTPTAILQHVKLHSAGVYYDPQMRKMLKHRKSDTIPSGMKGFMCKVCNYKTVSHQMYVEHMAYHRHQMVSRIRVTMKRAPPKEEYQRPKLKHQFVARNAKHCKKCTFKCISQTSFIEHVDRHGWGQMYKCYICDYSDNNRSIVDFHQVNHHIFNGQTLKSINGAADFRLENGVILQPESEQRPKPTAEELAKKSRGLLKCACCDFYCHVASELAFHMSVNHMNEPDVRETISYLHMGLIPPQAAIKSI